MQHTVYIHSATLSEHSLVRELVRQYKNRYSSTVRVQEENTDVTLEFDNPQDYQRFTVVWQGPRLEIPFTE